MSEPLISQFTGAVDKVVDQFRDQGLTVGEALGALDLIHAQIIKTALEAEDDELPL
jgi:hypothetical protein